MMGQRSLTMSTAMSKTPSSLGESSLDSYLPQQIFTPREVPSKASSVEIPKIKIDETKPKRVDKGQKQKRRTESIEKSPKLSPFLPIKNMEEHVYREGSPLPQQILTPRNADDIINAQEKRKTKGTEDKPRQRREKKPKGDLIDKDKNLLKIYNKRITESPLPGISTPHYQQLSGTEQDHEISDIEV